jgi:tetratricopeptide (TPR) repeat protein
MPREGVAGQSAEAVAPSDDGAPAAVGAHLEAAARALPRLTLGDGRGIELRLALARCLVTSDRPEAAERLAAEVLALRPNHLGAHLIRVDAAVEAEDTERALSAVEEAGSAFKTRAQHLRKRLEVLRRGGRRAETVPELEELHGLEPGNADPLVELGRTHQAAGDPEAARRAFERALEIDGTNPQAWIGLLDTVASFGGPAQVEACAERAVAALPEDLRVVEKAARARIAVGRHEDARTLLEGTIAGARRPPATLRLALALAHRKLGAFEAAEAQYAVILAREPRNLRAWMSRIEAALEQGDLDLALDICGTAMSACPDSPVFARLRIDVLRRAGTDGDAVASLEALHGQHPTARQIALSLADALRQAGRTDEADSHFDRFLRDNPGDWPALQGRVSIAEARGDLESAMSLLEGAAAGSPDRMDGASIDRARTLRLAEVALRAGDEARLRRALAGLEGNVRHLVDEQLTALLGIARRTESHRLVAGIVREAISRTGLAPPLAIAVLRLAHESGDAACAERLESDLAGRIAEGLRGEFLASAARMRCGPDASLALRRRGAGRRRNAVEASKLGAELIAAGRNDLARRYLRRCARRWPRMPAIRGQFLASCLRSGRLEEARAWADAVEAGNGARATEGLRLALALGAGEMEELRTILTTQIDEGRRNPGDMTLLRTLIALGDLDRAEEVVGAIKADLGHASRQAAHFGIGHVGALLNELRLYRRGRPEAAGTPTDPVEIGSQFFAAKEALEAWAKARPWRPGPPRRPSIPRRIHQYWNDRAVPAPVRGVMESWRSVPDWEYRCLDRRAAISWLRETFGDAHARAFKLANHAAEESDFLRLCLLAAMGGIYADADDRLLTSPKDVAGLGAGLILFVEPHTGAVQNNLICAPAGHPVLLSAVELATTALLRRDNDSTWSKTGPGLLTRAAALHVVEDPNGADRHLTLVPRVHLQRHVQIHVPLPYKSTPGYWNAGTSPVDSIVRSALAEGAMRRRAVSPSAR